MKKILVVDDELGSRESLKAILNRTYEVETADSALAAESILAQRPVDLLLLDIMMPQKDGLTFLREVREMQPRLPVIMISAYSSPRFISQSLRLGAIDYLTKPFDITEVRFVVEKTLQAGAPPPPAPEVSETGAEYTALRPTGTDSGN
ncbi:MAG: response regulator [Verrucomicrobiae bacterium]|nr:response regulator [Verrucomicrobiae bacterium]